MRKIFAFSAALLLLVTQAHAQITPGQGTALVPAGGAGGGGGGGSGTLTSFATTCPTTSAVTSGAVTLNGQATIEATNTSGAYTIATTDCGKVVPFNLAGGTTVTLPATGVLPQGYVVTIANVGTSGNITVNANGSGNINAASSLTISPQTTATIYTTDVNGLFWQQTNYSASTLSLSGSSGAFQTNNGSGNLGSVAPAAGVATAMAATPNANGGLEFQNGAITAGDLLQGSSTGVQDTNLTASGTPSTTTTGSLQNGLGYVTGSSYWYLGLQTVGALGSASDVANTVYCTPLLIQPGGVTIKALGVNSTANTASTFGSAAIYYANGTGGRPGTLIDYTTAWTYSGSTGTFSAAMNGGTDTLKGGTYWACMYNSTAATHTAYSSTQTSGAQYIGSATITQVLGSSSLISGIDCLAGSACGSTVAWVSSTPGWGSMTAATWTNLTNAVAPIIAFQVN